MNHPVKELIAQRSRDGSKPGHRTDSCKLGLVIEGGAMRGVVSAGMVAGLQYLGLSNVFDAVYGCSAGAINGAYFLAGQAPYGTTIYYENINNNRFIDFKRALHGKPVVSLEFLLDEIVTGIKVLDWKAVLDSPVPLKVLVSSVTEHRALLLENLESREELFSGLKASARIPVLAGPPIVLRDHKLLDGSIYEAIPFRSALLDKCSHLLVLLTRPPGGTSGLKWRFINSLISRHLSKIDETLAEAFRQRSAVYQQDLATLAEARSGGTMRERVLSIFPSPESPLVGQLEKRRSHLLGGATAGMRAMLDIFSDKEMCLVEIIAPFNDSGQTVAPL